MNPSRIIDAKLHLAEGQPLSILNPSLHDEDGYQILRGFLDRNEIAKESDIDAKLGFDKQKPTSHVAELPSVEATGYDDMPIKVCNVQCVKWVSYSLEVEFHCHTHVITILGLVGERSEADRVTSVTIEGLKLQYTGFTKRTETRELFYEKRERLVSSQLDFREATLPLHPESVDQHLRVAFIEADSKDAVTLVFNRPSQPSIESYSTFRNELCRFLSFAMGNDLVIREEVYWEGDKYLRKTHSVRRSKRKVRSEYIPIAYDQFRNQKVLESYLNCFPTFLHLDSDLGLSEVIFLVNQSKRVSIESGFFILSVAIEKLADCFLNSRWSTGLHQTTMDSEQFKAGIDSVSKAFDDVFAAVKETNRASFDTLRSRLMNINMKSRTDSKIDALLDYAEVERRGSAERLFPKTRNHALHEGNIDVPAGAAWDNYQALVRLVNECIANLIQYKGVRLLERNASYNLIDEKSSFTPRYTY